MRIGIDARMYRKSSAGIGRYIQNLIKNLFKIDKDNQYVLFMTAEDREEFEKLEIKNSLQIANCKLKIVTVDIPHYSLSEQTKLGPIIAREKLDLMHFTNFNHPIRYKGQFVTTIHDLTLFFFPETARRTNLIKRFGYRMVMKAACENSTKIIAVSESTKKDIIKTFHLPPEKIQVIYEAADDKIFKKPSLQDIDKLRKKYRLLPKVILTVGQWRSHKNLIGLVKAYELIRRKMGANLIILGQEDPEYLELKAAIDNSPYKRDIIRPGFVSDEELSAWYHLASVFVFPSFYEGFGLPGLEAMQVGAPVAASRAGSLPEIFEDAAYYFNPHSPQEMAQEILKILINDKIKAEQVARGFQIAKKYSWRKTAEETLKLYKQIIKSKS